MIKKSNSLTHSLISLGTAPRHRYPTSLRLELSSEADLFFHYRHVMDENSFRDVQQQQKLMIQFPVYAAVLTRMLNLVIREPAQNLAIFLMKNTGQARLDFIQNMEYKFVELLSADCDRSPEESIQHHITYRWA